MPADLLAILAGAGFLLVAGAAVAIIYRRAAPGWLEEADEWAEAEDRELRG